MKKYIVVPAVMTYDLNSSPGRPVVSCPHGYHSVYKVFLQQVISHEQRGGLDALVAKLNAAAAEALGTHCWTHCR